MKDVVIRVAARSESGTRVRARARVFEIVMDEPRALGGDDMGPTPLEALLASLAGCLGVTGHKVAGEMGMAIRALEFEVAGHINPGRFMGKDPGRRAGFDRVEVTVRVDGDADAAALERWRAEVEKRCPVSDSLGAVVALAAVGRGAQEATG